LCIQASRKAWISRRKNAPHGESVSAILHPMSAG
jgi:hypothetical protein